MDKINTLTQSGGLRMRLNVSEKVPAEVATSFLTFGSTVLKLKLKLKMAFDDTIFDRTVNKYLRFVRLFAELLTSRFT
jgi:hypothetical protein